MSREEAIKWLIKPVVTSTEIGEIKAKELEAYDMAIEALKEQDAVEKLTQDLADKLNDAYAKGYKDAKREIAVQGRRW